MATRDTPRIALAAVVSIEVIFAWAYGLRTTAMCSSPGGVMLSVQRVRPVISRSSSLRARALPTSGAGASVRSSVTVTSHLPLRPGRP